ncbi:stage III sporulation protein AF [Bacillus xiapuensis]|uniref:stage III sporulation protein AF n=1 Tax=Bacillus xiapuensis TaxID=2014075 RepID=UPI000C236A35|nr:stage III sporulation protein AF [Bacillus xiapuensis]
MAFLSEWLGKVLAFILLAVVVDMLLPSSSFQKYAKFVIGLLLLFVMLTPLWKLFSVDMEKELNGWAAKYVNDRQMEQEMNRKKERLDDSRKLAIVKNSEQQLRVMAESELNLTFQKSIVDLEIEVREWQGDFPTKIEKVDVYLTSSASGDHHAVDEVVIHSSARSGGGENKDQSLLLFLSKTWNIPAEQLNIHMIEEGGQP